MREYIKIYLTILFIIVVLTLLVLCTIYRFRNPHLTQTELMIDASKLKFFKLDWISDE